MMSTPEADARAQGRCACHDDRQDRARKCAAARKALFSTHGPMLAPRRGAAVGNGLWFTSALVRCGSLEPHPASVLPRHAVPLWRTHWAHALGAHKATGMSRSPE